MGVFDPKRTVKPLLSLFYWGNALMKVAVSFHVRESGTTPVLRGARITAYTTRMAVA
jgi:hypothetical protein